MRKAAGYYRNGSEQHRVGFLRVSPVGGNGFQETWKILGNKVGKRRQPDLFRPSGISNISIITTGVLW